MPVAFESVYVGFYLYFATHCYNLVSEPNRDRILYVFNKLISKIIEAINSPQISFVFKDQAAEILRWIVHLNYLKKDELALRYTTEPFEQRPTLPQVLKRLQVLTEISTGYRPYQDPSYHLDHVCSRELDAFLVQELRWFLSWIMTVSETGLRDLCFHQQRLSDPRGQDRDLLANQGLFAYPVEHLPIGIARTESSKQFDM
jgi:hypothetical protein